MIYIIVGPSHAGKTSFTVNSFIHNQECKFYKDIVGVTECDTCYLIGNYCIDKRAKGSDTIARQEVKLIYNQIKKLLDFNNKKDIILEGDKICSHPLLDNIQQLNEPCKLYYIVCDLDISIKRNQQFNSTVSTSVLKRVYTKALNIYNDYHLIFDGEYINTNDIVDFTNFKLQADNLIFKSGYYANTPKQKLF